MTLVDHFEAHRAHLQAMAHRMLGSTADADDAVQEAWLRLTRADADAIDNLGGWLTTVVARLCLDVLRSRAARREDAVVVEDVDGSGPDAARRLADAIGVGLVVVLDLLTPAERIAFVLHDVFDVPFDDIAPVLDKTAAATRQLASRARRRVQGVSATAEGDRLRQRTLVDAFLAAARDGNFDALLAVLAPDVVVRADAVAIATAAARASVGAPLLEPERRGPQAVADTFQGRARAARPALVDGRAGATWAPGGVPKAVFRFGFAGDAIVSIELILDPDQLAELDVVVL